MNTEVLFKTTTSTASSIKSSKNQANGSLFASSNASRNTQTFKREMDKAFDRKNNSATRFNNNQGADKYQSKDLKKSFERNDAEVTVEQQELAAAQVQAQTIVLDDEMVNVFLGEMKPTDESLNLKLFLGQGVQKQSKGLMEGTLQPTEKKAEGQIQLPFQNNVDAVKAALLKEATEQKTSISNQLSVIKTGKPEMNVISKAIETELLASGSQEETTEADAQELPLMAKSETLDLSKVNIKVADAPVDTTKSNAAEQLADKIIYKMNEGKQEFELQLNPRELGKLNIKLTFENGNAQVLITCSNSKAQNILASLTENVRGILEANTIATSTIHLQQEDMLEGQYNQDSSNRRDQSGQNSKQQEQSQLIDDLSFVDKLRLGLIDSLEVAV